MATILICDDDDGYAFAVKEYFEGAGHTVKRIHDAGQFPAAFQHVNPDVLILDMQMPGGGGPGALKFLEEADALAHPTIVCSGMPVEHQKKWFAALKKAKFVKKPVEMKALLGLIDELAAKPAKKKA